MSDAKSLVVGVAYDSAVKCRATERLLDKMGLLEYVDVEARDSMFGGDSKVWEVRPAVDALGHEKGMPFILKARRDHTLDFLAGLERGDAVALTDFLNAARDTDALAEAMYVLFTAAVSA